MADLDKIKNPRHGLRKRELESLKHAYKGEVDTKIDNKHFYHFTQRFLSENEKVLQEAREEMDRINKKRKGQYLGRLRGLGIIK